MSGTNAKNPAEVKMVTPEGLFLVVEDKGFFAAFADFPYLAALPSSQVIQVEHCGHGHIRWEEADIDLHTNTLAHPEDYPLRMQPMVLAATEMGRGVVPLKASVKLPAVAPTASRAVALSRKENWC